MESNPKPKAGIYVEETYRYDIDLGTVPVISQQKAEGSIRVQIPYDGKLLKNLPIIDDEIRLGSLDLSYADDPTIREKLIVTIPAPTGNFQTLLKSPKVSVIHAEYAVEPPSETLFTVDGEVVDVNEELAELAKLVDGDFDTFKNALKLITSFWFPNFWKKPVDDETLENLLLQQQDKRQIFHLFVNYTELKKEMAKSLAALANTEGGFIFIGINEQREVIGLPRIVSNELIDRCLLEAALGCSPHIHFNRPHHIKLKDGKRVIYVKVPASVTTKHKVGDYYYYRKGSKTISEKKKSFSLPDTLVNSFRQVDNMLVAERKEEKFHPLDDIEIDLRRKNRIPYSKIVQYICGLINTNQVSTRIVLKNFAAPSENLWDLQSWRYRREIRQKIEQHLQKELQNVLPILPDPKLEVIEVDDELLAVIQLRNPSSPVALYNGKGFKWEEGAYPEEMGFAELFDKYLSSTVVLPTVPPPSQLICLQYAKFDWSIQPPCLHSKISKWGTDEERYDVQHRAIVWDAAPFSALDEKTDGYNHQLILPLHQALLELEENGGVRTKSPDAQGEIFIRLHNVLPSGLIIEPEQAVKADDEDDAGGNLLRNLPIIKQTNFHFNLQIRLKELFERRRKTTLLHFRMLDVDLTAQRLIDLHHICADLGFRTKPQRNISCDESGQFKSTLIEGNRNKGFYDIFLALGVKCEKMPIKRELRFEEKRIDSRDTSTAIMDIHLALQGTGSNVAEEISQLQMRFYETVSKRFHHLHTE